MRNRTCSSLVGVFLVLATTSGHAEKFQIGDLSPIDQHDWNAANASHLLDRAGIPLRIHVLQLR